MGKLIIKIDDNVDNVYCDNNEMLYDEKEQQFYCETTNGKHKIKIIKDSEKIVKIKSFTTSLKFNVTNHICSIQNNIQNYEYKVDITTYKENSLLIFKKEIVPNVNFLGVEGEIYKLQNTLNSNVKIENIIYNDRVEKISKYFLINVFFTIFIVLLELCFPIIMLIDNIIHWNEVVFKGMTGSEACIFELFAIVYILVVLFSSIIKSFYYKKNYHTFYKTVY